MTWRDIEEIVNADPPSRDEIEEVLEFAARGAKARFYADENFPAPAVDLLRRMGARVQTTHDRGAVGHPDESQAAFALKHGLALVTCDRDYLNERLFPLIHSPAIFVFDFGGGSVHDMAQAFRCLRAIFSTPQFYDKWVKVDACRDSWIEYSRHSNGTTSRSRYRLWRRHLQEWVEDGEG